MKRKILFTLFISTLVFAGCGNSSTDNSTTSVESTVDPQATESSTDADTDKSIDTDASTAEDTEELQEAIQGKIDEIANQYEQQDTTESLDNICMHFESLGFVSGERTKMAGEMIGAISGVKYSNEHVEIYEYDVNSDKYKELVNTGKTTLEGFNTDFTPTAIHEEYVLYCEESENKSEIVSEFNNLFN